MSHSRRDFLRSSLVIGAAAAVSRFGFLDVLAQSTDYKALVCIFLYGGNDSNNMVVPNGTDGYQAYARARGPLALPQASLLAIQPSSTGARFGLHPSLNELHPLWTQKKLAVLCNVGTLVEPLTKADYEAGSKRAPDQLFSHQDQQNQWQTSICDRPIDTGWGGRIADRVLALNGSVAFPMIISGGGDELFVSAADTDALGVDPNSGFGAEGFDDSPESTARYNGLRQTLLVDTDHTLVRAASTITKRALDSQEVLNRALAAPVTTAFPVTDLGTQLAQVAHIIAGRSITGLKRQIFFCAQGGYDTHSDEMNSHVQLYTELSQALSAFYAATVELGVAPQVTTFTLSDFGRTFRPNTDGTDHAWGSHQLILGGAVRGGDFYGTFPTLELNGPDSADEEGRWIPTTAVDQYAATLASWFGVSAGDIAVVAPNIGRFGRANLGFLA
ncbi:MAG TPA: DUF1501 domain-containing protein [Pyrinomonadaceae bacterium]|nr:DUF1501 domain-containing protein [Pyrinomonadaceae bacterium]